jgi:hypothetical protein
LIGELLDADRAAIDVGQEFESRRVAAWIRAQDERIRNSELAKMVGVHPSTVGRWLKDLSFLEEVTRRRGLLLEHSLEK